MGIRSVQATWHVDDDLRDGYLVIDLDEHSWERWRVSQDTYETLAWRHVISEAAAFAEAQPPGEYLIPMSIIAGDARREVELALEFQEPAESEHCTLPTCLQPTVSYERGFPLCAIHTELMQDWDALVA